MSNRVSEFVFKHRKFFHIATVTIPIPFKIYFKGTTPLFLLITCFILIIPAIAFRMYSASFLCGRHITTKVEADYLCTSGPFAYLRNPLYLGNFIIYFLLCISFNEWYGYVAFFTYYTIMYSILIPYEERFLKNKFGLAYEGYAKNVRRFIPRLKSWGGGTYIKPDFKAGILKEKYYVVILIIIFILFYLLFIE